MAEIADLTSSDLARLYRSRALSPVEVAKDVIARIEAAAGVNAFMPLQPETTLAAARESEARWSKSEPLGDADGVPATIKDNIWAKGWPTRRGSRTTGHAPEADDAPVTARLREQGAVIVGKTTLPEHGWIGVCHSPLTGITRNPWNLARTPGGSTGGGAVAALMSLGRLHLGTDGAGSLRIPAAFTGVIGFKPTVGTVPVYPASPLGELSHHGPVAATVGEVAQLLSIIARPDKRDMRAINADSRADDRRSNDHEAGVSGVRIAFAPRFGDHGLDPEIERLCRTAVQALETQGAIVDEKIPPVELAQQIIRPLWWSAARHIVDAVPIRLQDQIDAGFRRTAEAGRQFSAAAYIAARIACSDLYQAMLGFHRRYDLLVSPTMPLTAFAAGHEFPPGGDYSDDWLDWSPYTYPFNLTGQPAVSVPVSLTEGGLPAGLQIVGLRGADRLVLRAARAIEAALPMPQWRKAGISI